MKTQIITPASGAKIKMPGTVLDANRAGDTMLQDALLKASYETRVPRYFSVRPSSNAASATGDGTIYAPVFDTEIKNDFDLFDVANNKFVAKESGTYLFHLQVTLANVTATAKTSGVIGFNYINSSLIITDYARCPFSENDITATFTRLITLNQFDELYARIAIGGGSADVTVRAMQTIFGGVGASHPATIFTGIKLSS